MPRDLETIVHKAIDRDPAHRYADGRRAGRRPAAVPRRRADPGPAADAAGALPALGPAATRAIAVLGGVLTARAGRGHGRVAAGRRLLQPGRPERAEGRGRPSRPRRRPRRPPTRPAAAATPNAGSATGRTSPPPAAPCSSRTAAPPASPWRPHRRSTATGNGSISPAGSTGQLVAAGAGRAGQRDGLQPGRPAGRRRAPDGNAGLPVRRGHGPRSRRSSAATPRPVSSLAYRPDGQQLATGGRGRHDPSLGPSDWPERAVLRGRRGMALAYSSDGRRIALTWACRTYALGRQTDRHVGILGTSQRRCWSRRSSATRFSPDASASSWPAERVRPPVGRRHGPAACRPGAVQTVRSCGGFHPGWPTARPTPTDLRHPPLGPGPGKAEAHPSRPYRP